jgi:hypothetical protein
MRFFNVAYLGLIVLLYILNRHGHTLYSPNNYSPASWKTIVPNMASRVGLSATELLQVL